MSQKVTERSAALLDAAEANGSCAAPPAGPDRRALQYRSQKPDSAIISPMPLLFARKAYWDRLREDERAIHIMRGLQTLHPDWIFCCTSAALAWDLPVSYRQLKTPHVASGFAGSVRRSGVQCHNLKDDAPLERAGLKVTTFPRTVFDCLSTLPFDEALAVADAALRRLGVAREELARRLEQKFKGCNGISRVLAVCDWAEPASENGGESIARAHMILAGAELPRLQMELPNPSSPARPFRVDYFWRDAKDRPVFGELDGKVKYTDERYMGGRDFYGVVADERRREALLTVYHASMLRFSLAEACGSDFGQKLALFGVPMGEPPKLRRGVPVLPRHLQGRPTVLAQGVRAGMGKDGTRAPFEVVLGTGGNAVPAQLVPWEAPELLANIA